MSETFSVVCDNCGKDLSSTDHYPEFSLRLIETTIRATNEAIENPDFKNDLDGIKNFCNIEHLKEWLNKK